MNGRLLLDTNAIIALLGGHQKLNDLVQKATWIGISVISVLEFLAFQNLSSQDHQVFQNFISRVEVIGIDPFDSDIIQETIRIRKAFGLKIPDAIIAASAYVLKADLVSNDAIFNRVSKPTIYTF